MKLANITETKFKRVVIAGAGFGGLRLARRLAGKDIQVVLIDKNNYHSFQPLFYQVSTAGIEPSAIAFPLRKIFQRFPNVHIRIGRIIKVNSEISEIETNIGTLSYDYLVIAMGAGNNFFNNTAISKYAYPMKSIGESLALRNSILGNFERALNTSHKSEQTALMNFVVVGGGPTGVELSGSLAEMKKHVLPKDYPELDFSQMQIFLIEGAKRLLNGMSERSSKQAMKYVTQMGVSVVLDRTVIDYKDNTVYLNDNTRIPSETLIWAAGIKGNRIEGINKEVINPANRLKTNRYSQVEGYENIYAIGDISIMTEDNYPKGHPQVAQVAIQQAKNLAENILRMQQNKPLKPFTYHDLGTLATVGRNKAVVDLKFIKFRGLLAWFFWMFIHIMAIVGVKNRLLIFINWAYNYFTYDQSLRLIIKPKIREV